MRSRWLVILATSALMSCREPTPRTSESPTAAKSSSGAADHQAGSAAASAFDSQLASGRTLGAAKRWREAQAALEAAVAERPNDAVALAELGWAAFHAGDVERARSASTLAVEAATEPNLKAMALYNLGLAIEAADAHAALSLFRESLNLRENKTVAAAVRRLANKPNRSTVEGDALLERVHVLPVEQNRARPSSADETLIAALVSAGYEWEGAAGTSHLVANLDCAVDGTVVACGSDGYGISVRGDNAKAILLALEAHKVRATGSGDRRTLHVSVRCTSSNEGYEPEDRPPEHCEVVPEPRSP